jgi:hypothetical protein
VRADRKAWDADSGFAVGQQVSITGEWSFSGLTFARNSAGDTITRNDVDGNWITDGFAPGQTILLSNTTSTNGNLTNNGSFTIKSVSADGKTLTLTAANTVVPTDGIEPATIGLTGNFLVTGFADSGTTLLLQGMVLPRQADVPMTVNIDAPLVVYGDTSQDGVWYNGVSDKQSLGKFSSKPQPHMDNVLFTLATPTVGQTNPSATSDVELSAPYTGLNSVSNTPDTFANVKRTDGGSWLAAGFIVDGLVTVDGDAVGMVYNVSADT